VLYKGLKPVEALTAVEKEMKNDFLSEQVKRGLDSAKEDDETAVRAYGEKKTFGPPGKETTVYTGKSCNLPYSIPSTIHFIARYENETDPLEAIITNIAVGGESSTRGILIALLLFAYKGLTPSATKLIDGLTQKKHIEELLSKLAPRPRVSPHDLIMATFASDALALGAHWCYDNETIKSKLGRVDKFIKPELNEYHKSKNAGDFTHNGDNAVFLLESLVAEKGFDSAKWGQHWYKIWKDHHGYKDHATRETLAALASGKTWPEAAFDCEDLDGVVRFFPLLALYKDEESLVKAAREQCAISQKAVNTQNASELFARAVFRVLYKGLKPVEALTAVEKEMKNDFLSEQIKKGLDSAKEDDETAVRSVGERKTFGPPGKETTFYTGKSCNLPLSIPSTVHFIARYENEPDPLEAVIANIAVGGESSTRGILIALLLFAHHGITPSATKLIDGLTQKEHIKELLAKL
jgi:ADP-ribosylglycohydrolase